ncbi:MAG: family 78 glycoside hydrolase catalytic domain [Steroidobacteraceae bacterium]
MKPAPAYLLHLPLLLCFAFASFWAGAVFAAAPSAPTFLLVNDAASPIGIGAKPFFGWRVNDRDANEIQTKYQVRVAATTAALNAGRGEMWDSGEVTSRDQNHVTYEGSALAADRQYFWQVRTWDKTGAPGPFSAPATFTVGPVANEDWSGASWIRRTNTDPDDYTYFRKRADLPNRPIRRATVYIASVHKYELFVNGQLVGKGPAYQYPQYQYYNGYDITSRVKPGANLFAIFNHWFGGGQGRATSARGVLMKAVVHYTDGSSVVVGTDGGWKQRQAPQWVLGQLSRNPGEGVGFIERIDARQVLPNWNQPGFDDAAWAGADVIGPHPTAPWINPLQPDLTRIVEKEITPATVKSLGDNAYLVDLGKVYAGMPRVTFEGGTPGQLVTMTGGYMLGADGRVDPTKNQSTNLGYFAELNGGAFTYAPVEYFGMRYLQIENSPVRITPEKVKFVVRHSQLDETRSAFTSPNPTLNAVWDFMKRSIAVNAQEEFVDTPTREKGGFLGDGAIMSTVAMPVVHERLLTLRQLNEFLASMDQFWNTEANRGRINAVYPNNDNGRDIPDYTQAFLVWVWDYYMETGDAEFLRTHYSYLKAVSEYVYRARRATTGLITDLPGGGGSYDRGIIDWPASMRYGYDMLTSGRAVINYWAYADFDAMSRIAGAIGHTADRDLYRIRANELKTAINAKLLTGDGVYIDGLYADEKPSANASQHANMFPLALGLVPDAQRASVIAKVKELKMSVGMVTALFLVRGLGEAGEGEQLIELFTNAEWPGWARTLALGGTATWESWNSNTEDNSQSHAWGAAGLEGYVRYILGIKPTKPGYEDVQIKPLLFGTKLLSARGTIPTDRGDISVSWERSGDRYAMTVSLPVNVTSFVHVPKGSVTNNTVRVDGASVAGTQDGAYVKVPIGSGTHRVERAL